jgi:hypothetical protein
MVQSLENSDIFSYAAEKGNRKSNFGLETKSVGSRKNQQVKIFLKCELAELQEALSQKQLTLSSI